jgi:type II secretory pathway pseudopilin PulG
MKKINQAVVLARRARQHAFNLIEVTVSVAIITTAVAVLLGMFSVGLKASRDAADYTMATVLANSVLNTLVSGGGGGSFARINLYEFGTVANAATFTVFYQQAGGTLQGARTYIFNASNPTLTPFGTQQPFILFFDEMGRTTNNTGTGTGTLAWQIGGIGSASALARRPYYRVEFTFTNNSSLVPGASVTTVTVNVRWPCIRNPGSLSGWRPRRGGPTGPTTITDVFIDNTVTYFGIIIQNNK